MKSLVNFLNESMDNKSKYNLEDDFDTAIISSGTYNTKDYYSKKYKDKKCLFKGLKAHSYTDNEVYNGMTWNVGSKQYKLSLD